MMVRPIYSQIFGLKSDVSATNGTRTRCKSGATDGRMITLKVCNQSVQKGTAIRGERRVQSPGIE